MVDKSYLEKRFFFFDEPVVYTLKDKNVIKIYPVQLKESEFFLDSVGLLMFDKNSSSIPEIIQMSYLSFIVNILFQDENNRVKLVNILLLSLRIRKPKIILEKNNPVIIDEELNIRITHKDFDDIMKIILYQNLINYDDEYVDPNFKKSIEEVDALKNKNKVPPNIERKIAIITAHTGISKKEQLEMTFRSHCVLFNEVEEEIRYNVVMPIAIYGGKGEEFDTWIYKKKEGKFDKYITNVDSYTNSMGSNSQAIKTTNTSFGDSMELAFNQFNN